MGRNNSRPWQWLQPRELARRPRLLHMQLPVRTRAATLARRSRTHARRSRRVSSLIGPACCPCRSPVRVELVLTRARPEPPRSLAGAERTPAGDAAWARWSAPPAACAARPCAPEPVLTCARLSRHARTLEQRAHPREPSCARTPPQRTHPSLPRAHPRSLFTAACLPVATARTLARSRDVCSPGPVGPVAAAHQSSCACPHMQWARMSPPDGALACRLCMSPPDSQS
jgi:hypothetical protein